MSLMTLLLHRKAPDIFHLRNSFVVVAPAVLEVVFISFSILLFQVEISLPYMRPHAASDSVLINALLS